MSLIDWNTMAIAFYQQAIKLNSQHAGVYFALGQILREQGKIEEAQTAYQNSIKLQPEHFQSYIGLGHCYRQQKDWESAITSYQQAIQLNSQCADIYFTFPRCGVRRGRRQRIKLSC